MKKNIYLLCVAVVVGVLFGLQARAVVIFPVAELGNCGSQSECRDYCNNEKNIVACVEFGEKNGLVSKEEAEQARKFADVLVGEGPGGCKNKDACENYCDDIKNIDACLSFAEKHDLIPLEVLKEAKQVARALRAGVQLPGGCKTKDECESYCQNTDKILECVDFAEKAGFISAEEAAMVKKTGGKGPGDCRSREACEAFCGNPKNQQTCFDFAKENDLIPPEKLEEMKAGLNMFRQGLAQMPEEMRSCVEEKLGADKIAAIEREEGVGIGPEIGEIIQGCVANFKLEIPQGVMSTEGTVPSVDTALFPPEINECVKRKTAPTEKFSEVGVTMTSTAYSQSDLQRIALECAQELSGQRAAPPTEMIPPPGFAPTADICKNFAIAPSCSYVPEQFRDMCEKCRTQ